MTPTQYEALVARHFRDLGYDVVDRPATNDWGIDVLATKGAERVAVQVKMYGGSTRPVNRAQVMELHGAAAYFDCTKAVLATNGRVMPDAIDVASKLGIEILTLPTTMATRSMRSSSASERQGGNDEFDRLWEQFVMPLAGKTLARANGSSNTVVTVDWAGLDRITSNGRAQRIKIEIFRLAVRRVLEVGHISRDEINALDPGRASSGIVLILSQIPWFTFEGGELRRKV